MNMNGGDFRKIRMNKCSLKNSPKTDHSSEKFIILLYCQITENVLVRFLMQTNIQYVFKCI